MAIAAHELEVLRSRGSTRLDEITSFAMLMDAGDELWWFTSVPDAAGHSCGEMGLAIVRRGLVVRVLPLFET